MSTFMKFIEQVENPHVLDEDRKTAVFATGRMNPPTKGHQHIVDTLIRVAEDENAQAFLLPTQTYDGFGGTYKSNGVEKVRTNIESKKVKNPLRPDIKLQYIKKLLGHSGVVVDLEVNALTAIFRLQELGFTDLIYVSGSDYFDGDDHDQRFIKKVLPEKAEEMGITFKVVDAGTKTKSGPGVSGYKSSYARKAALDDDIGAFRAKTGWSGTVVNDLMKDVRKGMGLHE